MYFFLAETQFSTNVCRDSFLSLQKLQAIEQLKAKQAQGASLELNQVEKIKTEDSLRAELEKLTLWPGGADLATSVHKNRGGWDIGN